MLGSALIAANVSAAGAQEFELIGSARAPHLSMTLVFRPSGRQSHLSELRVRSGSLALHLEAVEIVFADGSHQRAVLEESLGPGHQSRSIRVDSRRRVREILVMKRSSMKPGETMIQILGRVAPQH